MADDDTPRSFVTVAFIPEVAAAPELLGAYASVFGPDDDATLVLYAPDSDPATVGTTVEPALARAGIDEGGGPDMIAMAVPAAEGDPALGQSAHAILTRDRALGDLPRFDDTTIARLRAAAEAAWRPAVPSPSTSPELTDQERFDRDLAEYRAMPGGELARDADLFPQLGDWRIAHEL